MERKKNKMEKTQKIYIYAVVPYEEWNEYSPTDDYGSEFDYWASGDYQVFGIVIDNQLIFLDDNMHNSPFSYFDGAWYALSCFFNVEKVHDILYLDKGVYEYDSTAVQEAIYKKWKSEN
jgi:hypothetical protein